MILLLVLYDVWLGASLMHAALRLYRARRAHRELLRVLRRG